MFLNKKAHHKKLPYTQVTRSESFLFNHCIICLLWHTRLVYIQTVYNTAFIYIQLWYFKYYTNITLSLFADKSVRQPLRPLERPSHFRGEQDHYHPRQVRNSVKSAFRQWKCFNLMFCRFSLLGYKIWDML